jgi:hypothetical protein
VGGAISHSGLVDKIKTVIATALAITVLVPRQRNDATQLKLSTDMCYSTVQP